MHKSIAFREKPKLFCRYVCDNPLAYVIYKNDGSGDTALSTLTVANNYLENTCLWTGVWEHTNDEVDDYIYCKSEELRYQSCFPFCSKQHFLLILMIIGLDIGQLKLSKI